jgi:hypothetical protein
MTHQTILASLTAIPAHNPVITAAEQDHIAEIQQQRDLYEAAFHDCADDLDQLQKRIKSLQGRLTTLSPEVPLSSSPEQTPLSPAADKSNPISLIQTSMTATEGLNAVNLRLAREIIAQYESQRDQYKDALARKEKEVEAAHLEIQTIEELARQPAIPLSPTSSDSPAGSPIKSPASASENGLAQTEKGLRAMKFLKVSEQERTKVLENLFFFKFVEAKTLQHQEVNIETMLEDPLLATAAAEAIADFTGKEKKDVDPKEVTTILKSFEVHLNGFHHRLTIQTNKKLVPVKQENVKKPEKKEEIKLTYIGVNKLVGQVEDDYGRYTAKLRMETAGKEYRTYSDFIFSTLPCCAGQLYLLQKRYEHCRQLYADLKNDPEQKKADPKFESNIDTQIALVTQKLKTVERLQTALKDLLQKCLKKAS